MVGVRKFQPNTAAGSIGILFFAMGWILFWRFWIEGNAEGNADRLMITPSLIVNFLPMKVSICQIVTARKRNHTISTPLDWASFKWCTTSGSDRQTRLINVKIGHGSDTNLTCVFWEILHELKSLQTVLSCHSYNPFCGLRITRRMEGDNKVNVIYCTVSNKTTREGNLLRKLNENALFHIAADRSLQTQLLWSWVPKKLIKFTFSIWYLVQKSD